MFEHFVSVESDSALY